MNRAIGRLFSLTCAGVAVLITHDRLLADLGGARSLAGARTTPGSCTGSCRSSAG